MANTAAPLSPLSPNPVDPDLRSGLLTDDLNPLEHGLAVLSLETLSNNSFPVEPYYVNADELSEDETSGYPSLHSSTTTWFLSPLSHLQSDPDADTEETTLSSLSEMGPWIPHTSGGLRPRHWSSGTLALFGGFLALMLVLNQLKFFSLSLKKGAVPGVSVVTPQSTSSSSNGAGGSNTAQELSRSYQESEIPGVIGNRQWLLQLLLLTFSLVSATFLWRLKTCPDGFTKWQVADWNQHTFVQELGKLCSITNEPAGSNTKVAGSDPAIRPAICKFLDKFRGQHMRTHQSAFSILFHLAAQSRMRQIKYSLYRNACDTLHAKVEQSLPIRSEEVAEVLRKQQELLRQYVSMISDVAVVLHEKNLPPELCEQEMEFLTRDLRPALIELASHTLQSLDKDRKFLEASITMHHSTHGELHEEHKANDAFLDGSENPLQQEQPPDKPQDTVNNEMHGSYIPGDVTLGEEKLIMLESEFWEARRTLSSHRKENFSPKAPDLDRCFLPELPLSLFAY